MKAFYYKKYGDVDVIEKGEMKAPKARRDDVLVKVTAIALNPLDYRIRRGEMIPFPLGFPKRIASDFSGLVLEAGKNVKHLKPGDKVYGMTFQINNGCSAEIVKVSAKALSKTPSNISLLDAASIPLAAQTSLQALRDLAGIKKGDSVFINGASGGTGVFALQIAKIFGAVITGSCSEKNAEMIKKLGADQHIDYHAVDFKDIKEDFDIFYDCYGNKPFSKVKHLLKENGCHISNIPNGPNFISSFLSKFGKKQSKVVMVRSKSKDLNQISSWIEENKLKTVIEKVYSTDEIKKAYLHLETKRAKGKLIVDMKDL